MGSRRSSKEENLIRFHTLVEISRSYSFIIEEILWIVSGSKALLKFSICMSTITTGHYLNASANKEGFLEIPAAAGGLATMNVFM